MSATYQQPEHGWTCFHCGETFTTVGAAMDHFGATPDREPGCLIRVKYGHERGLEMELRKVESARDMWQSRARTAEESLEGTQGELQEFRSIAGGSVHALRMKLDAMQGRVATAEVLIEGFRSKSPEIFAEVIE